MIQPKGFEVPRIKESSLWGCDKPPRLGVLTWISFFIIKGCSEVSLITTYITIYIVMYVILVLYKDHVLLAGNDSPFFQDD
jgi:hypothetical protein